MRTKFGILFSVALLACSGEADPPTDSGISGTADTGIEIGVDSGPSDDAMVADSGVEPDTGMPDTGVPDPLAMAAANPDQWHFVDVPGMRCRDGSSTGIGVRFRTGGTKLAIYLLGGGACFNGTTCGNNPSSFTRQEFETAALVGGNTGIFSMSDPNPLKDHHQVFVPYCTGDTHAGQSENEIVPGVNTVQQFVGYDNMTAIVETIMPGLGSVDRVLLTGSSAGGYGAVYNYAQVADAFAPVVVDLVNDSGPTIADTSVNQVCLQQIFTDLWNLTPSLPEECATCFATDGSGLPSLQAYLPAAYPDANFGLIAVMEDATLRFFLGFGANSCMSHANVPGPAYSSALTALRTDLLAPSGWSTYFISGDGHVAFDPGAFFQVQVDNTLLTDWVTAVTEGTAADVGP